MSVAIGYTADLADRRDLASEVIRYCEGLTKQHSWAVESFDLRSGSVASRLEGWTKFMPAGTDAAATGFGDLCKIVEILHSSASRFSLFWRVQLEGIEGIVDTNGPDAEIARLVEQVRKVSAADNEAKRIRGTWLPAESKRFATKGKQALQRRWNDADALAVLESVFVGQTAAASPFGQTDAGRLDLRGVNLSLLYRHWPLVYKNWEIPYRTIENVDLSFAQVDEKVRRGALLAWAFGFRGSVLDGIHAVAGLTGRYDRCSLRGVKVDIVSAEFHDCDLSYLNMHDFWTPTGEKFQLDYANISGSKMTGTTFVECSFQNTNLNNVEMGEARFIRCTFEGASFDNTFYSKTVFEQCIGLDLERMAEFACFMCGRKLYDENSIMIR